jgi:N-acetylglucosaminyldiphosphoundecaprenol N-acetyl-beta-D-mannosaminyltransferase
VLGGEPLGPPALPAARQREVLAPTATGTLRPAPHATRAVRAARVAGSAVRLADAWAAGHADAAAAFPGPARDGAWRAARRLVAASPGLRIAGCHSPAYGFDRDPRALGDVCRRVIEAEPDLVYVGIGFPRQERLISRLRPDLPGTWFLGCGAAVNFVAGDRTRAPRWMQRAGLEWAHRLAGEPGRLAGRYVRHDAPYAMRLLARAWAARRWS